MPTLEERALGQARITRIPELVASFEPAKLLPEWTPAAQDGRSPEEQRTGTLAIGVHAWLLRRGRETVLVDAGVGNGKQRSLPVFDGLQTPFLDRLRAAGAAPEAVTHVLLTHLHADHVGWLTTRQGDAWVPTFPNAQVILPRAGYDWFTTGPGQNAPNRAMFEDSVLPVVEAGHVLFVPAEGQTVLPGIDYLPTPGHSADHMSILLQGQGDGHEDGAIFAGDVLHHPVQIAQPELCSSFCADKEAARRSRRLVLDLAARQRLLWFSSHFARDPVGRVRPEGDGYRWQAA